MIWRRCSPERRLDVIQRDRPSLVPEVWIDHRCQSPPHPPAGPEFSSARRARLPGSQAGARPRKLRRARLARLPPSRRAGGRGLRLPAHRAARDSPLSSAPAPVPPSTCPTRGLPTPRRPRSDRSATSPVPSPVSIVSSPWHWQGNSSDVPAAYKKFRTIKPAHDIYDAVRLAGFGQNLGLIMITAGWYCGL